MAFEVECWFCCSRRSAASRRGLRFPSRAGASGSRHLPWALPRILPTQPKTKRPGGGSWRAGRVTGGVCSKGANSAFILDSLGSGIAAGAAGRRRGNGRGGKAQQRYRATTTGKQKRNGQSRRYRERVRSQKPSQPEAVDETARVIIKSFFRWLLRPARLLREIRARAAISLTALLLAGVPAGAGARRTISSWPWSRLASPRGWPEQMAARRGSPTNPRHGEPRVQRENQACAGRAAA
jgi:hypothetical protein